MTTRAGWRIGFDIGGTFTDFVLVDPSTGAIRLHKCLTTPDDPARGAMEGLASITAEAGISLSAVSELVHGTTLVTNAIIERKGARVALITTRGFRDILQMGTEQRYDIYDLFLAFPEPLVGRPDRLEVSERVASDGSIVTPLDLSDVDAAADQCERAGVGAIAVMLINAFANPAHEQAIAARLAARLPRIPVSVSSQVCGEIREYPRAVTTCANAYVQPLMAGYLARLEQALARAGFVGDLRLMHSAGGLVSPAAARAFPIRLLESGPAGGTLATALFGAAIGHSDIIAFDMGGTTAKASLIEDGTCAISAMMEAGRVHRFKKGSGLPIKAPVIDMIEIGAGGGSIAAVDSVGLLKVGPHSAGAAPGPACYGQGGTEPTVTDANLLLGYYDPAFFLGGRMRLDVEAARAAMTRVGAQLDLGAEAVAAGIHALVTDSMAAAARVHLVERGRDPRRYAMLAFGGAGPAHACAVARALGVREVVIPPASGAASALGFLDAPLTFEFARSLVTRVGPDCDTHAVNRTLDELADQADRLLREAQGSAAPITFQRSAEMRLVGQLHELTVPLPDGPIEAGALTAITDAFATVYRGRYSAFTAGTPIEFVSFRVRASGPAPGLGLGQVAARSSDGSALKGHRAAWFNGAWHEAAVHDRYRLGAGDVIVGPAIVEEREATTVVPPRDRLTVDRSGCLRITIADHVRVVVPADVDAAAAMLSDPIALEIMWSRLITVVDEMWLTVCRTAFSLIISEAQDFACELLDPSGETLAHSPRAMPVFNLTLPRAVKALLARFPAETLQPGDVLITNDPWLCAGHLFDIALVSPVFRNGRLVALTGCVGHVADIGGTKDSLKARELYEEGLQIPPLKLVDAGAPNQTLYALIRENVRNPDQVIGDIQSFIAANAMGGERLIAFMDDYGLDDLTDLARVVQDKAEGAMRAAIRAIPDGTYHASVSNNPLGDVLTYPLALTIEGDRITLDFDGAPPQLPRGGLNCTLNYTAAHATYPLKCMLTPEVRGNAGCYRAFTVTAPEGSALNCTRPAAVNMRTRTGWYIAPNVFRALANAAPDRVQAPTGLPTAVTVYGHDAEGRFYADHLFVGGGQGASHRTDGVSALLWPTSAANTSIELFEQRVPVLVEEKTYVADSGGAGRHRGGLGQRVRMRKRLDDGRSTFASLYPEGARLVADGLFGGCAGGMAFGGVRGPDDALIRDCGTGELVELTSPSETAELVLAGGAGFGAPLERPISSVVSDMHDGFVTAAAAEAIYGVGTDADGRVDPARTVERSRPAAAE
jgi:5-oxoprolinase (ATP-hydrolysing)/N-methylhydantoinase A